MRGTGVPTIRRKMIENGSPEPQFEFDEARTWFRVVLPAHPEYVLLHALREAAQLWATGDRERAIGRLEEARRAAPHSGALTAQIIDYAASSGDLEKAQAVFAEAENDVSMIGRHLPFHAIARAYLDRNDAPRARSVLGRAPSPLAARDLLDLAILHKRSGQFEPAHQAFSAAFAAFPQLQNDAKALHEFAQTKIALAKQTRGHHGGTNLQKRRLNQEAQELLNRVIQLAENPVRTAWAWYDLARTLAWLGAPESDVRNAVSMAIQLLPAEDRFARWLNSRGESGSRR
jgi:ATP-dependent DNA helicase RecG